MVAIDQQIATTRSAYDFQERRIVVEGRGRDVVEHDPNAAPVPRSTRLPRGPAGSPLAPAVRDEPGSRLRGAIVTFGHMWEAFALRRETIEEFPGREHRRNRINQVAQMPIARDRRLHTTRAR